MKPMKIKTKNILVISNTEISKSTLMSFRISSSETSMIKGYNDCDSILQMNHMSSVNNKAYRFQIHTSNTIAIKDNYVYDAIVPIYVKNSNDSILFLKEYFHHFHKVAGNKLYPAVYVQYDNPNTSTNTLNAKSMQSNILDKLTLNNTFPIITLDCFDECAWRKIFNSLIEEMSKENNDAFPYHLVYKEEMKMNKCLKQKRLWNIINFILYIFIVSFSIIDLVLLFSLPDFLNAGDTKVDGVYFGIRFNANVLNSLMCLMLIKYNCLNENKQVLSNRIVLVGIIINLISLIIEILLHWRIRQLLNHNINYYTVQLYQGFIIVFYLISYIILKYLGVNAVKSTKSKKIVNKDTYTLQRD